MVKTPAEQLMANAVASLEDALGSIRGREYGNVEVFINQAMFYCRQTLPTPPVPIAATNCEHGVSNNAPCAYCLGSEVLCGWCHELIADRCQNIRCRVFGLTRHAADKLANTAPIAAQTEIDKAFEGMATDEAYQKMTIEMVEIRPGVWQGESAPRTVDAERLKEIATRKPEPTEQVDAARLPYSELNPLQQCQRERDNLQRQLDAVDAALPAWKYTGRGRVETIHNTRAASLKQETQPRQYCDSCKVPASFVKADYVCAGCGREYEQFGDGSGGEKSASSSPLETPAPQEVWFCVGDIDPQPIGSGFSTKPAETPAAVPYKNYQIECEPCFNDFGTYACLNPKHPCYAGAGPKNHATPAPADTGAAAKHICNYVPEANVIRDEIDYPETSTIGIAKLAENMNAKLASTGDTPQPQERPLTQADQKVYDPFAELEFIAKEINGEDIALEDLAGQLEHATQCLREMFAALGKTPDALTHAKALLKDCYLYFNARPEIDIVHATAEQLRAEIGLFLGSIPSKEKA